MAKEKYISVTEAKACAMAMLPDPILRGAVNAVLDATPAVDVAPVVHGRWKRRGRKLGECSECGEIVMVRYPYCPNCGARMDGGAGNG